MPGDLSWNGNVGHDTWAWPPSSQSRLRLVGEHTQGHRTDALHYEAKTLISLAHTTPIFLAQRMSEPISDASSFVTLRLCTLSLFRIFGCVLLLRKHYLSHTRGRKLQRLVT